MSASENQKGVALVYIAVTIALLAILLAVAVDVAWIAHARNQAQAAVDAAALSGAAAIPHYLTDDTHPTDRIDTMAGAFNAPNVGNPSVINAVVGMDPDIQPADLTLMTYVMRDNGANELIDPPDIESTNTVRVSKAYSVPLLLGGLLGIPNWDIGVRASAMLGGPGCFTPDFPVVLVDCSMLPVEDCVSDDDSDCGLCEPTRCVETEIVLAINSSSREDNAAFWTYMTSQHDDHCQEEDRNCREEADASECRAMVDEDHAEEDKYPYSEICAGQTVNLINGTVASCLQKIATACDADADGVCATTLRKTVPVIACENLPENNNMNQSAAVMGFARIAITRVLDSGSDKSIAFRLICDEQADDATGGGRFCGLWSESPILVE